MTTHDEQQRIWDEEHARPNVLLQMDSDKSSSGVVAFVEFLRSRGIDHAKGLEMGCGKGRNVIGLAREGYEMTGFDFSVNAIEEARRRAAAAGVGALFVHADATVAWPFASNSLDFGLDCFASTDIESGSGRKFAIGEMHRVLKPSGYLLAYLLSTDDEFHKEMNVTSPAKERNAFLHPTGKFEKTYDEEDIAEVFSLFEIIEKKRIEKTAEFHGKKYDCHHFWIVFRKSD